MVSFCVAILQAVYNNFFLYNLWVPFTTTGGTIISHAKTFFNDICTAILMVRQKQNLFPMLWQHRCQDDIIDDSESNATNTTSAHHCLPCCE